MIDAKVSQKNAYIAEYYFSGALCSSRAITCIPHRIKRCIYTYVYIGRYRYLEYIEQLYE